GTELFRPLQMSSSEKRWIVTAVDHITDFAKAATISSSRASEVTQLFIYSILLRHGATRILLSDRSRALLSDNIQEI
ncbi:MAG: hypothetical protein O7D30_12850, partial [Rickettsia endosymbiont of Ixodes persulcatus]|nr:hypothetical protein [Rickettsia endosymbiont of Ixodes persulcatus]